jgi:hypothetical protein
MSKDYFVIDFLRFTGYAKSLKTIDGNVAPVSLGEFFMPFIWGTRTVNILNSGQRSMALSESPTCSNSGGYLKIIEAKMKKSIKELQTENELLRATLALVMEKLKELTELLSGGCHE